MLFRVLSLVAVRAGAALGVAAMVLIIADAVEPGAQLSAGHAGTAPRCGRSSDGRPSASSAGTEPEVGPGRSRVGRVRPVQVGTHRGNAFPVRGPGERGARGRPAWSRRAQYRHNYSKLSISTELGGTPPPIGDGDPGHRVGRPPTVTGCRTIPSKR